MNKENLMQLCEGSEWKQIIDFASNQRITDILEYEIIGKAYRMLGQYDLAIATFELGSKTSMEGFWKSRFEILISDCLCLLGKENEGNEKLRKIEDMYKIKDNHQKYFILGWRDLQLAKYEKDRTKRRQLLNIANVQLEASEIVGSYDRTLKKRLQVTVYQQLCNLYLEDNMLDLATQTAQSAMNVASDNNLQYERVSTNLLTANIELIKGNYELVRQCANVVIEANLSPRMVQEAYKILEQLI